VLALLPLIRGGGGVAPTPGMFGEGLSLAEAEARASETGRLTLVFATADWCGPCQSLKRGALTDERVEAWVNAHTVPTMLDLTSPGAEGQAAARRFGVRGIPALILLRDGEMLARREGVTDARGLLRWLEEAG
jgi:thiol:disulfide interchange protein